MSIAKPPYGSPCNGCGDCCRNQLCPLAEKAFPAWMAPCPALVQQGNKFVCGLVTHPERYAPVRAALHGLRTVGRTAALLTGAGLGCDAAHDEPIDLVAQQRMRAACDATPRREVVIAMNVWGILR